MVDSAGSTSMPYIFGALTNQQIREKNKNDRKFKIAISRKKLNKTE